uniref:Uncharacterized protein n=1 Tax=Poecilia mexicana TaxID=48701 RepID=A0A3B3YFY9_9TELE
MIKVLERLDPVRFCSAVSWCVNSGSAYGKLLFGPGTRLTVQNQDELKPDYYKLGDNSTTVCLATGFTRHNGTKNADGFDDKSASQITDLSGKPTGYYSQVAFLTDRQTCGDDDEKTEVQCDASLEPDEMVNLASITIFGLRVIFMKTVAFNVLMTLRLWMSQ